MRIRTRFLLILLPVLVLPVLGLGLVALWTWAGQGHHDAEAMQGLDLLAEEVEDRRQHLAAQGARRSAAEYQALAEQVAASVSRSEADLRRGVPPARSVAA